MRKSDIAQHLGICLYYNADSLGVLISIVIATALTLFLVCMKMTSFSGVLFIVPLCIIIDYI